MEKRKRKSSEFYFEAVYSTLNLKNRKELEKYVKKDSYFKLYWIDHKSAKETKVKHYLYINEELSDIVFSEQKQGSEKLWMPRFGNIL